MSCALQLVVQASKLNSAEIEGLAGADVARTTHGTLHILSGIKSRHTLDLTRVYTEELRKRLTSGKHEKPHAKKQKVLNKAAWCRWWCTMGRSGLLR